MPAFGLFVLASTANAEKLSIKGLEIGTPKAEMNERLKAGFASCNNIGDTCTWLHANYGKRSVVVVADLIEEKICRVSVIFSEEDSIYLGQGLVEKFGEPQTKNNQTLVNGFGVKYSSLVFLWRNGNETLKFSQRSGRIDEGQIVLSDRACEAKFLAKDANETKTAADEM